MDLDLIDYEKYLIKSLFTDTEARDKLVPFLDPSYFDSEFASSNIIKLYNTHVTEYNAFPTAKELVAKIKDEDTFNTFKDIMLYDTGDVPKKFIQTEAAEFFKQKMVMNNIFEATELIKNEGADAAANIPDLLKDALSFSFDTSIGMNFAEDGAKIYDELHDETRTISTGIQGLDDMIKGGFKDKTLSIVLGGTNVGKTLTKCALAVNAFLQNKNVLYVSLEMSEAKIAERMIANIFDIGLDKLDYVPRDRFIGMFDKLKQTGNLYVKEYPARSANSNNIRALLKELEVKKKFKPDIIFVDYLGLITTNQKTFGDSNTNTQVKIASEELRAVAQEFELPIVTGAQTNRGGMGMSELDLTDIADSIGQTMTADIIIGLTQTEEMLENNIYKAKILKNRQGGRNGANSVMLKVDFPKMRLTEAPPEADELDPNQVNEIGSQAAEEIAASMSFNRKKRNSEIINYE